MYSSEQQPLLNFSRICCSPLAPAAADAAFPPNNRETFKCIRQSSRRRPCIRLRSVPISRENPENINGHLSDGIYVPTATQRTPQMFPPVEIIISIIITRGCIPRKQPLLDSPSHSADRAFASESSTG